MLRLAPLLFLLTSSPAAPAQSLPEYARMRKQHHVAQASDASVLGGLVGTRVVEVRGVVKGSFRAGDRTSLLVDLADGRSQVVETVAVDDWLIGNEVPARLLVRASRADATSPLRVVLIGAAPESDVQRIEANAAAAAAKATAEKKKISPVRVASKPANNGSRAPLSGMITRRGTKLTNSRGGGGGRNWTLPASEVTPIYAAFIKKQNPSLPNAQALRIAQAVVGFSLHYKVDARLVMAILMVESGFNPNSVSRSGAMGLGQLMPGTARWMGVADPFDTTQNLYGSVKLLRQHLDKYRRQTGGEDFESLVLSLAAYNAGEGAVRRHGGVPPYRETQSYVRKVVGLYYKLAGM